jgi:hypothetical protein
VLTALEVISIHGSQKDARNIEQGFASGQRDINCLQDEKIENGNVDVKRKSDDSFASRPIELEGKDKRVQSDPKTIGQVVNQHCNL